LITFLASGAVALALLLSGAGQSSGPDELLPAISASAGLSYELAEVRDGAKVELHSSPDGPVVATLGAKTEFDSPRTFYVAKRSGEWLGVPAAALPDGHLGWIRDDPAQLDFGSTAYSLHADLSQRTVDLLYGKRLVSRIPVTVGAAGTTTPPGTFAVTDGLAGRGVGPWYGCCILALTGHQANLPSDWIGGDRIAIHGTPGPVGGAASHGCLRASNRDMVTLFALVPLGAPVFVRE
jgi:hypothetical protein